MDKPPTYIQVDSTQEFTRLVCALERIPRVSFLHDFNGQNVISVQMDVLKERPIIYYTPINSTGDYLSYGFKSGKEETSFVTSTTDSSCLYSPIIKIKSLPDTLKGTKTEISDQYQPIELEDLASLVKLSYGFEEAPFPLFSFPHNSNWLLGVFMNFNEEGSSYFCHVKLKNEPSRPFLKYSTTNGAEPLFVDNTVEHGYSYIKIIKLRETHPLVNYDQLQN